MMFPYPFEPDELPEVLALKEQEVRGLEKALEDPDKVRFLTYQGGLMGNIRPLTIPPELGQLKNLEVLALEYFSDLTFTEVIAELHQLKTLILLGNEFAPGSMELGPHLGQIPQLETITAEIFYPVKITADIADCRSLKELWIDECDIEGVEHISKLPELRELTLDSENLARLLAVGLPPKLERLRLTYGLPIPEEIKEAPITSLALNIYTLKELPAWMGEMKQLEELDLYGTQISALPDNLPPIKRLNVKSSPLAEQVEELRKRFPDTEIFSE